MQQLVSFMQNILDAWERVRRLDFRELTFTQIFFGVTGFVVALWIIGQILSFVLGILNVIGPLALVMMVLYAGYRWSQSRSDEIPDEMKKSKKERAVEEAVATVQAHKTDQGTDLETSSESRIEIDETEDVTVEAEPEEDLKIKQILNPETGFMEPDISRLIEHEESKLKEADEVNNDIMAQLEARRKRLKND